MPHSWHVVAVLTHSSGLRKPEAARIVFNENGLNRSVVLQWPLESKGAGQRSTARSARENLMVTREPSEVGANFVLLARTHERWLEQARAARYGIE